MIQFNWYFESGGDNDEALTWGRDLINLFFFPKMSTDVLYFSFSRSALADVFEKKNKTTAVYRLPLGVKVASFEFIITVTRVPMTQ